MLSRSGLLERLIGDSPENGGSAQIIQLGDIPGGVKAFELVAKFCYAIKIELTALNVVSLRCAAEYLQMTEEQGGEGNLIMQTEIFLNVVFGNWSDTIKALETCEQVLPFSEELHIVSRCINSLAMKACADPNLFNLTLPSSGCNQAETTTTTTPAPTPNEAYGMWNGISTSSKPQTVSSNTWWYEDVSFLSLPFYKRLVLAVEAGGMQADEIAGSLVCYAKKYIPLMNRQSSFKDASHSKQGSTIPTPSEADQRVLLEEIVELIPNQRGVTQTKFLIRLLRTSMILHASPSCRENLEKRVGLQLDQATVDDLLIPNMGYSVETLYDVDCFQRILEHFMSLEQSSVAPSPTTIVEENQLMEGAAHSLTSITMVANLVDAYLADVATDVNLKFPKFQTLAASVPDYARPLSDGIYRAIDIYLKVINHVCEIFLSINLNYLHLQAHPWLTDGEREQICRLMNCQKLSLEASTHAAQNERLPLRVIVQVLFFEQLRLRTSISGWFFVSDTIENSQNQDGVIAALSKTDGGGSYQIGGHGQGTGSTIEDMKQRVMDLEKECDSMRQDFHKLVKSRRSWNIFCRRKSHTYSHSVPQKRS